ncbi:MAG: hypothetical protein ACFFCW_19785 [Candidatus Hodarchaeota archaeon]
MNNFFNDIQKQVARQVAHWTMAAYRLENLEDMASPTAWEGLERYLGITIRQRLLESIHRLQDEAKMLRTAMQSVRSGSDPEGIRQKLDVFRKQYLRTEITLDFFADAINTRTNPEIAALVRACDIMAQRSMQELLDQLGMPTPPVLTYLDKGKGASILKARLRLWDGKTENPAAAIKIVRHNLYRPTALIHESGHQVAHIIGWNKELATALQNRLAITSNNIAEMWANWASEIAADMYAFVHTGYASVAGLHDVVAGSDDSVFRYNELDPHPISYLRVLLGTETCRQFFGTGPWDELERAWRYQHPVTNASPEIQERLRQSLPLLPMIVKICLRTPMRSFHRQTLTALIDPDRVNPKSLLKLRQEIGPALFTSRHWIWSEPIRLLALTGFQAATIPNQATEILNQQKDWMLRLGTVLQAA